MRAYERFLNYIKIDTTSNDKNKNCPSSENQWILANYIVNELKKIGISNAHVDDNCYVYAKISSKGDASKYNKKIGFIAHMDTSPSCAGGSVNAKIIRNYNGNDIVLENGIKIKTEEYAFLEKLISQDIIVTDGETLLGADNKAGIAEIITLCEILMSGQINNHCEVLVAFTPDEEIGRGADLFNVEKFGADFAFTVDGGELGEVEYENFNAATATIIINGINIHPGSAKNIMKNSQNIAMEFDRLIPSCERPENTEGYEGFYHLTSINGNEEKTEMAYIIRDHDSEKFKIKKNYINEITMFLNKKHGDGTIFSNVVDSYYN
ncbi:MAG: peptidase T, partial [Christensenellaceae bacterium]|nr:peptidase T [Christensenellaceae bacterium]